MLSRDADSCYWIGRYMERAEATARLIDVHYHSGLEGQLANETLRWSSILAISGDTLTFDEKYDFEEERDILQFFVFDNDNPNSIWSCIAFVRENARSIREQISSEMWECLNTTYLEIKNWDVDRIMAVSPHTFFSYVKGASQLFAGVLARTSMVGESGSFLQAGRYLERAGQTARTLDVKYHDLLPQYAGVGVGVLTDADAVGGPIDIHGWLTVLRSVGAYEAFKKTYRQGVTPANVTAFLILNPGFPASVIHCAGMLMNCLRDISGNPNPGPANAAERAVGRLYSHLNYRTPEEIIATGLHEFLDGVQASCNSIGAEIAHTYLMY